MNNKKNFWLNLGILSTLVSVGIHAYLAIHYFELKMGVSAGQSLCNINAIFNCDAVSTSSYSVFMGVPIAIWGLMTNLVLSFMFVCLRFDWSEAPQRLVRYSFYLATFVAIASLVMGSISSLVLGQICLFCFFAYILSFLTFTVGFKSVEGGLFSELASDLIDSTQSSKYFLIALLLIPAGSFLIKNILSDNYGASELEQVLVDKINLWQSSPVAQFTDEGLVIIKGEPKFTIVEFADFLCPHCKHAEPTMRNFVENNNNVKFVFKPFPLDGKCNPDPALQGRGDGVRCDLAAAVFCAEKLSKKGWDAHKRLFDHQENIFRIANIEITLSETAKDLGLEYSALKECVKSDEAFKWIQRASAEGIQAKVQGTPTVFANGRKLEGGVLLPILKEAYNRSLK